MNERRLHEQVRQAFAGLTRPPRPQLTDRIRDSLWERTAAAAAAAAPTSRSRPRLPVPLPARETPRTGPPGSLLAFVAGILAVALVAALVLFGGSAVRGAGTRLAGLFRPPVASTPGHGGTPPAVGTTTSSASPPATPSATPTETPTPAPTETPPPPAPTPAPAPAAPPVAPLPGYGCGTQSGGGGAQGALTTARVGTQGAYDRFVIQFGDGVPQYEVRPQDGASFGGVTLDGSAGLVVTLSNATAAGSYSGPTDFHPGYPELRQAKLLGDGQGTVQWGLGLAHATCFRAWTLTGPSRLVVDVQV
jgi:hypothetical protein